MSELTPEFAPVTTPLHVDPTDMPTIPTPRIWSIGTRLAFRFAFTYLLIYALCCANATLWEVIPFHIGEHI